MSPGRKTVHGNSSRRGPGRTGWGGFSGYQNETPEYAPWPEPGVERQTKALQPRKREPHRDDDEKPDRYLITYADLITLLLGLFIVLYAVSQIDVAKYQQMMGVFGVVFGGHVPQTHGTSVVPLPTMNKPNALMDNMQDIIKSRNIGSEVSLTKNERGITIHMMEQLLFTSGSADLKPSSYTVLDTIAQVLRSLPNDIRVEGHTDDVPIATAQFPSNWHLSVTRALNTAFYIITKHSLNPDKVAVVGYSEFKPLVPNISEENRGKNRRVDIVILDRQEGKK